MNGVYLCFGWIKKKQILLRVSDFLLIVTYFNTILYTVEYTKYNKIISLFN